MHRHPGIVGEGADGPPLDIGGVGVRGQYHVAPIISSAVAVSTEQRLVGGMTIYWMSKEVIPPGLWARNDRTGAGPSPWRRSQRDN